MQTYLIVGQGVAGTLLAHFLLKAGKTVHIVDEFHKDSASKVAAGIINPVTGRRIVKSWRIDNLLPFAKRTYREIERLLGVDIFTESNILRAFDTHKKFTDWSVKSGREDMCDYISDEADTAHLEGIIQPQFAWGSTQQGGRADLSNLVTAYRQYFVQQGMLEEEKFDYAKLEIQDKQLIYKGLKCDKIIFCEGWKSRFNPYFGELPHEGAKGESLTIRIPNIDLSEIIKAGVFIVPLVEQKYWIGATYAWDPLDSIPTQTAKNTLIQRLEKILISPYEILGHQAAVRPVFRHRRPVIGWHSEHPQLGIFNGLGTKGASIAPFWAAHFCQHICEATPLDPEVSIGALLSAVQSVKKRK